MWTKWGRTQKQQTKQEKSKKTRYIIHSKNANGILLFILSLQKKNQKRQHTTWPAMSWWLLPSKEKHQLVAASWGNKTWLVAGFGYEQWQILKDSFSIKIDSKKKKEKKVLDNNGKWLALAFPPRVLRRVQQREKIVLSLIASRVFTTNCLTPPLFSSFLWNIIRIMTRRGLWGNSWLEAVSACFFVIRARGILIKICHA